MCQSEQSSLFLNNSSFSPTPPFLGKVFHPHPYCQIRGSQSPPLNVNVFWVFCGTCIPGKTYLKKGRLDYRPQQNLRPVNRNKQSCTIALRNVIESVCSSGLFLIENQGFEFMSSSMTRIFSNLLVLVSLKQWL